MSSKTVKKGLTAIAGEVIDDVLREAEKSILQAEAHAKTSLKIAKDEADEAYNNIIEKSVKRTNVEKQRIESLAEVEARNQQLQLKEDLVNKSFDRALEKLMKFVETDNYSNYLLKLIEASAKKMGSEEVIVFLNSRDANWVTSEKLKELSGKLKFSLKLSEENIQCIGGCRIQTVDGTLAIDNTLENQIQNLKSTLRVEVAKNIVHEGS